MHRTGGSGTAQAGTASATTYTCRAIWPAQPGRAGTAFRRLPGGLFLAALALACAASPWLPLPDPDALDLEHRLAPPSPGHPLGTDAMGRDLLSRALHGGRLSLALGLAVAVAATGLGVGVGAAAATGGRRADAILMRGVDLALSIPALFVALLLGARAGGSPAGLALVLASLSWMEPARLARAALAPLAAGDLAAAARAVGGTRLRIAARHLVPQAAPMIRAAFVLAFAHAVLAEATLSFLGFGVQPPQASWGTLIAGARPYASSAPWTLLGPAAFLFLSLWSANRLGRRAPSAGAFPTSALR